MNKKGLLLVLSTAVISGFSVFINKYGLGFSSPHVFAFLKNALVALILSGFILLIKDQKSLRNLTKKQWLLLLIIGFVGGGMAFLLFFKGLSLTSAAQGSFIHKTMFVYVAIFAAVFLKEKINIKFLIGALLLLFGAVVSLGILPVSFGVGDFLIFGATILWAIENIISKYVLRNISARIVAWARMFFGSFFILGYLGFSGQLGLVTNLGAEQFVWVILTSVILLAYVLTWYSGLKYVPVSTATAVLLLGSPITTFLSFINGSGVGFWEIISGVMILGGLVTILGFQYFWKKNRSAEQKIYVGA